jgi:hypothetical protein
MNKSRNRINAVEVTVVQKLNIAAPVFGLYICLCHPELVEGVFSANGTSRLSGEKVKRTLYLTPLSSIINS